MLRWEALGAPEAGLCLLGHERLRPPARDRGQPPPLKTQAQPVRPLQN